MKQNAGGNVIYGVMTFFGVFFKLVLNHMILNVQTLVHVVTFHKYTCRLP